MGEMLLDRSCSNDSKLTHTLLNHDDGGGSWGITLTKINQDASKKSPQVGEDCERGLRFI